MANLPVRFNFNMVFSGNLPGFFQSHWLPEVNASQFLDQVNHVHPAEWLAQVQVSALVVDLAVFRNNLGRCPDDAFSFIHDIVEVVVSSVGFQFSKFRVVLEVHPFISEDPADFVNPFHVTDDQTLQRQFQGNPHVEVDVQSVVVSDERTCFSPAWDVVQNWRFNFQEVLPVQVVTDGLDDLGPVNEALVAFVVGDQVQVALAINGFNVLKTVVLVRQWPQSLGQEGHVLGPDRQFA